MSNYGNAQFALGSLVFYLNNKELHYKGYTGVCNKTTVFTKVQQTPFIDYPCITILILNYSHYSMNNFIQFCV